MKIGVFLLFIVSFLSTSVSGQNDTICILTDTSECEETSKQVTVKLFSSEQFIEKTSKFFDKYENERLILKKNECLGENIYSICGIDTRYMTEKISSEKLFYYNITFSELWVRAEANWSECSHNFLYLTGLEISNKE